MSARFRTIILALATLSLSSGLLAADDPMMETWNLNVPKSQLGSVVPRSIVRKHIPVPGGVKVVQDRVDAQGKASTGEFTVKFDGKDYSITGDPYVDRLSLKRVGQYRVDGIGKKGDKTATTFPWQVSKDGNTLTYTTQRLYPPERVGTIIQILDKQR
jgi:hypothetical protein